MISQFETRDLLRSIEWHEGKMEPVIQGPYRHEIVVVCSSVGRQRAIFADGAEHSYFAFMRIINAKGEWTGGRGGIVVPVLPNRKILMVVEQRPAQSLFPNRSKHIEFDSGRVPLISFGPYSSLEFPGGGFESGESLAAAFLRELTEETGTEKKGILYIRKRADFQLVSDYACQDNLGVIYLEGISYVPRTENDGGLTVLALSEGEVIQNIRNGVIVSSASGLLPWYFYEEVERARRMESFLNNLCDSGYLEIRNVTL